MIIAMIKGATRICGKAQGYLGLPVRDSTVVDKTSGCEVNRMETAWTPTPDELERLNKGANIIVSIFGNSPPPMLVSADDELPDRPARKIIGYRWASIFNPDTWTFAQTLPENSGETPQYITRPIYDD